jgi:hypothetical protein
VRPAVSIARLAALIAALTPDAARAHGREPSLSQVDFDPADPAHMVVQATWGFLTTRDAGRSFTWQCADAAPFDRTKEDPPLVLFGSGVLVGGTLGGIVVSDPSACTWSAPSQGAPAHYVIDVTRDPANPRGALALESPGGSPDVLLRTSDEGRTWQLFATPNPAALTDRVRVAPSEPNFIYTSGVLSKTETEPRRGAVLFSRDGGQEFATTAIPLEEGESTAHLLAVDPRHAERVFVRMVRKVTDTVPERLLLSEDGGESFRVVLDELTEIVGFANSADGTTVWVGSWDGGLYRSDDSGLSFDPVDVQLRVRCLEAAGDVLWACLDGLAGQPALARSRDRGQTFEPVWRFADLVNESGCAAGTTVGDVCPSYWIDLTTDLGLATLDAGVGDSGTTVMPATRPTGSGCHAGTPRQGTCWVLVGVVALVSACRRRLSV